MMKNHVFFFLLLFSFMLSNDLFAQDKIPVKFGKIRSEDFDIKAPAIDSNANAVVIAEWGYSQFVANTNDLSIELQFTKKARIKIINKNGFDAANIIIYLYNSTSGNGTEKLESLKAYTYNNNNGAVRETKVENSSVFTERKNKNWTIKKFSFPDLNEGSIIEYSYTINSPYIFNLQPWEFQGEYPCIWSEYNADIPEFYKYVVLSQGYQPFFINKVDHSQVKFTFREKIEVSNTGYDNGITTSRPTYENFDITGFQDNHQWVMKNVPGLKPESFITTLNNHIAKIEFQLSQIHYPNTFAKPFMSDWKKVAENFRDDEKFGGLINKSNGWLDEYMKQILTDAKTQEEKARNIFQYVRNNFSVKTKYGVYATTTLKDVFKNKGGTVADINLLLVAMLRHEKIEANPVILSTRSNGFTSGFYPLMDRFNYVIVNAKIDNNIIYLDASDSKIGFGKLPLECYNGHAREVTKDFLNPVYFNADSLKESSVTNVLIITDETGSNLSGSVTENLGYYASLHLREELANTTTEQYEKQIKASLPEYMELKNFIIDSVKNYDEPIAVKYETKYSGFGEKDLIYFNPLHESIIKKNPFVAAQRFYPVEMPFTQDQVYLFNMEIPKGYVVDEIPKSVRLKLEGEDGMFEYIIRKDETNIQMRVRLKIDKANFTNDDYETLRDFYTYIVKKQSEQIVFKKVK